VKVRGGTEQEKGAMKMCQTKALLPMQIKVK
jgi:hypothetical protein